MLTPAVKAGAYTPNTQRKNPVVLSSQYLDEGGEKWLPQIRADSGGRASYEQALALAQQEPERRFLARRLEELK